MRKYIIANAILIFFSSLMLHLLLEAFSTPPPEEFTRRMPPRWIFYIRDIVLMICSASALQGGVGVETVRDAMAGFGCAEAVELEGGAAACLFLDGERLLPSVGEYVPLSCVGLMR